MTNPLNAKPTDINRLVLLIHATAAKEIDPKDFIVTFRQVHEQIEREGHPQYDSLDQAQLIWDVLWAMEFYEAEDPSEAKSLEEIIQVVNHSSGKLKQLEKTKQ